MARYSVKVGRRGGGSGTFVVEVNAASPDDARRIIAAQYPDYVAQSVTRMPS